MIILLEGYFLAYYHWYGLSCLVKFVIKFYFKIVIHPNKELCKFKDFEILQFDSPPFKIVVFFLLKNDHIYLFLLGLVLR